MNVLPVPIKIDVCIWNFHLSNANAWYLVLLYITWPYSRTPIKLELKLFFKLDVVSHQFYGSPGWRRGRVTSFGDDSHSLRVFLIDEGRHAEVINRPGRVSSLVGKKWENLLKYPPAASKVGISGEKKILPPPFHEKSAKWNFRRSNSSFTSLPFD